VLGGWYCWYREEESGCVEALGAVRDVGVKSVGAFDCVEWGEVDEGIYVLFDVFDEFD